MNNNDWISVDDEMPEPYAPWVIVRAVRKHGNRFEVMEGTPANGYWFAMDMSIIHVTHWTPAPLPLKETR